MYNVWFPVGMNDRQTIEPPACNHDFGSKAQWVLAVNKNSRGPRGLSILNGPKKEK
jgi:hypothetical protein